MAISGSEVAGHGLEGIGFLEVNPIELQLLAEPGHLAFGVLPGLLLDQSPRLLQGRSALEMSENLTIAERLSGSLMTGQPLRDQPNHFVTAGKTKDGQTYVYDPGNKPHYFTGKDAQQHLEKMIGVGISGGRARLVRDDAGNVIAGRRDVYAGASVIMQSEKTTGQIVNDVTKALNPLNWF